MVELESQLNDLDPGRRAAAFEALLERVSRGDIVFPPVRRAVNLHCHTFFSYNGYGYSPTYIAWRARCLGLYAAGVVDFDVLDAAGEFLAAARRVGIRACAGIETRAFVSSFETREINSPGEPGVTYHMGMGFATMDVSDPAFLAELKHVAQERNRSVLGRVNPYLERIRLDYDRDVLPLTPNGNATERHLCAAFDAKAKAIFPNREDRVAFWAEKLGTDPANVGQILDDAPALQGLIRAKTMKAGGVGYVRPNGPDFPALGRCNAFIIASGAIPVLTWLDGCSDGERAIEDLAAVMLEDGVAAVNIIPDRNWNIKDPETRKRKVGHLHAFIALAQAHDLPIVVGTEMNAPGLKFVDDFDVPEMAPLVEPALEGARILCAHTALQPRGMGYLSAWAGKQFDSVRSKNDFFSGVGRRLDPASDLPENIGPCLAPNEVLCALPPHSARL